MSGSLVIKQCSLTNLDGLSSLATVDGQLYVVSNPALTNLDGLSSLTSLGGPLFVAVNRALTNVDGLSSLASVEGDYLRVCGNPKLSTIPSFLTTLSAGKTSCFEQAACPR